MSPQHTILHHAGLVSVLLMSALVAVGAIAFVSAAYCALLLMAAWIESKSTKYVQASNSLNSETPSTRFCILIPAHDEELVIESTVLGVGQLDYPADLFRCVVIADNCSDQTSQLTRKALPNATVLERQNPNERGKGYALNWAIEQIGDDIDAIVIIDADTKIDKDFLSAMDRAINRDGIDKKRFVAQGHYQVLNSDENWRTGLMTGALSLVHYVRPLARERWRTSAGLKGNGMCFSLDLLRELKWNGGSLTEDIEYGIDLIEKYGIRVVFVPDAVVAAQMPTGGSSAQGQRRRWENGRNTILRERALPMLLSGLATGNKLKIDAAFDLFCPPLAQLSALILVWAVLIVLAKLVNVSVLLPVELWALTVVLFATYILAGFKVGKAPANAYKALGMAIVYVPWKLISLFSIKRKNTDNPEWIRTERKRIEVDDTTNVVSEKQLEPVNE